MWKRRIQRASYKVGTAPLYAAIMILKRLRYMSVMADYDKCCATISLMRGRHNEDITESLIKTLVIAEDHRNALHFGVDPIAIIRTIKVRLLQRKRQGASTIEQQLVRTITARYEKTPRRKVREQVLAVMLNSEFDKHELASCYLKVAYYGVSLSGYKGIERIKRMEQGDTDAIIVSHLKYPRSSNTDGLMAKKHSMRVRHVCKLRGETVEGGIRHSQRALS